MKIKFFGLMAMTLTMLGSLPPTKAAEKKPEMSEEMQAKMAKAKEAGTPGAGHEVLKPLAGNWTVTTRSWMKPGEKKPQLSTGSSTMTWVLDGRYLRHDFKGNFFGQPYEGLGYIGYDNVKKEYVSLWMDNFSTGLHQSSGQYDPATKTISETGSFSCPVTGEKNMWFRDEWKFVNNDKAIYSMFIKDPESGKEFKSMEIVYTRVK